MYGRLSTSLLLVMLAFSLLAPRLVSSQDIRNWNNSTYWAWNPKGVPPAWYGAIKGLPDTEWLRGHYSNGRFVYVYDFHYSEPPQEIVLIPNETCNLRLTVIDPLGNRYVLWEGYIPNFVYLSRLTGPMMNVARDKCRPVPSPGTLLIHNPLRALFSREGVDCTAPGNTLLQGRYTFIVEAVDGNLSPTDEPRIRVLGLSYGLMGTDVEGRDVWVGFAYGAEETVLVAILGAAVMVGLALLLGMLSVLSNGVGGVADFVSKFLTATPVLPASVLLIVVFGSSKTVSWNQTYFTMNPFVLALVIGVLLMGNVSRNVRSMAEEELRKDYIESSRALGGSPLWIL
ncbi:ABC transporter permease subunit [Thermococcus sp.]|uniref:ABC transporter permease subunit n=1 Tax=Thermococcus sp. TaxID=35749 RepID=UPI0026200CE0|nr:ABC transporter permease subunit [Thermococcus sp.]